MMPFPFPINPISSVVVAFIETSFSDTPVIDEMIFSHFCCVWFQLWLLQANRAVDIYN
jgi:hypothetical protein